MSFHFRNGGVLGIKRSGEIGLHWKTLTTRNIPSLWIIRCQPMSNIFHWVTSWYVLQISHSSSRQPYTKNLPLENCIHSPIIWSWMNMQSIYQRIGARSFLSFWDAGKPFRERDWECFEETGRGWCLIIATEDPGCACHTRCFQRNGSYIGRHLFSQLNRGLVMKSSHGFRNISRKKIE